MFRPFVFLPHFVLAFLLACNFLLAADIDFGRDVRPILSDKCYACHGPDEAQREAGLRLDTQEGAFADLGGYFAIVAGKPENSELASRVLHRDPDMQMPPADQKKQLSESEKQILVEWIEQGASWSGHWAYTQPRRTIPDPTAGGPHSQWAGNFIDCFILAKLDRYHLSPSPQADPRTLLRRLSFDLTGLPPTPEDVRRFEQDPSERAYERIVDRLLSSPHFGERMAIYWLDLVRYADTVGYHGDQDVSVSPFRDYVIQAFNENLPFDQFTREQLAGDLLPDPTLDQLVASGYNKLGMMSAEGGVQPEEYLAKYAADRVRTAGTVWLGSTFGCAECHNHKFDPFTTKDFYRFASFFADIKERGLYSGANSDSNWGPTVAVQDTALPHLLEPIDAEIAELEARRNADTEPLRAAQLRWEEQQQKFLQQWSAVSPVKALALHDTRLELDESGILRAEGSNPDTNTYQLGLRLHAGGVTAIALQALPAESLPAHGPGRADNGNFVVTEVRLWKVDAEDRKEIRFVAASASVEQEGDQKNPYGKWAAASAIDLDVKGSNWGWAVLPEVGKPQVLALQTEQPLEPGEYELVIEQNHSNPKHTLGRFQIMLSDLSPPVSAESFPLFGEDLRMALTTAVEQRSDGQLEVIRENFRQTAPQLAEVREQLAERLRQRKQLVEQHTRTSLITVAVEPREMRVLPRGNWMDPSGEVVTPGIPEFLGQLSGQGRATRLDLADWLTSDDNPLVARTFVNRLWKLYFGTGLSKTLDDIGSQGEPPSHPELLDTLAVEFMESGWDIKYMVKCLVMSSTYRQSSLMRDELKSIDPYNRLLARQSRFRLDAEVIRDNALAVSGLLVRHIGGRSVKPYQPEGLYRHLNFPTRTYEQDEGANQYRRGVYTHWQRQFLHPAMQAFDAPPREECNAERPRSNTPLAALVLLNDPSYVESARRFAEQILQASTDGDEARIHWMLERALNRPASHDELAILQNLLEHQRAVYEANPRQAKKLVTIGLSQPRGSLDIVELAAWTSLARAVMNMHEMVTRN